eukprot:COSAG03_NODE_21725_length_300_cov_0.875622_1_plen_28_part_10
MERVVVVVRGEAIQQGAAVQHAVSMSCD